MDVRNLEFLFYGFAATWLIIIGYVFYLVRRERRLRQELERVKNMLQPRGETR